MVICRNCGRNISPNTTKCPYCGLNPTVYVGKQTNTTASLSIERRAQSAPYQVPSSVNLQQNYYVVAQKPKPDESESAPFHTWKLVSGIICMAMFIVIMFQSCAVGLYNSVYDNSDSGGSVGFLVGIMMLAGGIVSVCTRNKIAKGGDVAGIVLFGLSTLFGIFFAGNYSDLIVWGTWCFVCTVIEIIIISKK